MTKKKPKYKLLENNPRVRTDDDKQAINRSLALLKAGRSALAANDGTILAGNATYEQVMELGIPTLEVETEGEVYVIVRRKDLDPDSEDARAMVIADNRLAERASWDEETLAAMLREFSSIPIDVTGFDSISGPSSPIEDPGPQIDRAIELQKKWKVKRGQIWEIPGKAGTHRVMCGDSTDEGDVALLLSGAVPNLCVTDPPYGVNYDPAWRSKAAEEGHLAYAASRIGEVTNDDRSDWRAAWELFSGDVIYSWHPPGATSLIHAAALQETGFVIRMQIIWAKSNFPIGRGDYHVRHEPCWYAVRQGKPSRRTKDRTQTTLWEINLDKNVEGGHSTQKPVECMARPIRNHEITEVYDPFLGSGTTTVAAEQEGRICYGMEIAEKYVSVTLQRLSDIGLEPHLRVGNKGKKASTQ